MAVKEIATAMEKIKKDEKNFGSLSCGEQIAVALILNRTDRLPSPYEHPLDAIIRLGVDWFGAVIEYHQTH